MHLTQIKKALPEFITKKLDFIIENRINTNADKKPVIFGMQPQPGDVVMQTNDYLDLHNNEVIKNAHIKAIRENKQSLLMSGALLRNAEEQPVFEEKLAKLTGFDRCVVAQSGWNANLNLLQGICDKDTNVYVDFFAHASLWEGARIAGAKVHMFMHNNMRHLKRQIMRNGPGIILVDSVYSTIGTIAPLVDLVSLAYEYDCALVVDESHSLGTHGPNGAGLVAELGLTEHVDFITASLAKTFAYRAGAILANEKTAYLVPLLAYPSIFSSAMLPFEMERLGATFDVIIEADDAREALRKNADYLCRGLKNIGFDIQSESQIFGIDTGDVANTIKIRNFFEENGVFGSVFCPPATPNGKHLIRFSINSSHTIEELNRVISVCQRAWDHPELSFT